MDNLQQLLLKFVIQLRALQLSYHQSHNIASRVAFFSDHGAFGDFYSETEGHYDSVAERIIGTYGTQALPLNTILSQVSVKLQSYPSMPKDNKELFTFGLRLEEELQKIGEMACKTPGIPEGTRQLVGDTLDKALSRTYKIKRRIL